MIYGAKVIAMICASLPYLQGKSSSFSKDLNRLYTSMEPRKGDFQERCHSLAAIQAALIKGSARSGSGSSAGLFIHTSAGLLQQRVVRLQRVGLAWRRAS